MIHQYIRRALCAAVPAVALVDSVAYSQSNDNQLEEIVVTAQKRTENVQSVPIAITAISGEAIAQRGITQISQLSNYAPNVNLDAGTPFSGSDTVLSAYIRGIGQDDFAFNLDPGVGVYVDGVYLARSVGANTTMLDVDRVEILKGPQGTLFGRNTIGGAISIITRDPGHEFSARGEVSAGSFNRLDTKLSFDLPLSERVAATLSFSEEKRDGYQRDIPYVQTNVNGSAGIADCKTATCPYVIDNPQAFPAAGYQSATAQGGINKWATRGKLVANITDTLKLTATADYLHVDQEAAPNTISFSPQLTAGGLSQISNACMAGITAPFGAVCTSPRGGLSPTPTPMAISPPLAVAPGVGVNNDGNPYNNYLPYDQRFLTGNIDTSYANGNNFSKLDNKGFGTVLAWDINDKTHLKWINSYRELLFLAGMDLDGSPETQLATSFAMVQHQVSEELQLNGLALNDKLDYSIGAYYFSEGGWLHDFVTFPQATLQVDGPNALSTRAGALYAHLNYKVTDTVGFTLGARQTWEHKTFQGYQTDDNGFSYKISGCTNPGAPNNLGAPANLTCQQVLGFPNANNPYDYYPTGPFHQNYTNFSPTAGIDWHLTPDEMLYASFSKGYKTGSWTTRLSSPHPTYDNSLHFNPEFATSEEIGLKSELMSHTLRLNVAAFHTKYDGIQLNSQIGVSPTIVNAGDATIYGAEVEAEWIAGGGLSFIASMGYTHAQYDSLNNVIDNGYQLTPTSCPERDPNAAAPGKPQVQNGICELPKTPKFKSFLGPQYVFGLPNGGALQLNADWTYITKEYNDIGNTWQLARPALNIVNASVTYKAPSKVWELALGLTNATDERYVVSGQNQGGLAVIDASYSPPREWFMTFRFHPTL